MEKQRFTMNLFKVLSDLDDKNIFFSPISIEMALAMVHLGARGNTKLQLEAGLFFPNTEDAFKKQVLKTLENLSGTTCELAISNSVYVSDKLPVLQNYMDDLREYFRAVSKNVDFGQSEAVRQRINDKVEKDTRSKIKDLIPAGALNALTMMVLVNAVYFKGQWLHQFKEDKTEMKDFHVNNDTKISVPMMTIHESFANVTLPEIKARALAIPYKGDRMKMVIILPDEIDGVSELQSKLASMDIGAMLGKMREQKLTIAIPKFKLEHSVELRQHLTKLGLSDMFDCEKADFSAITAANNIFVSEVFHKSFLEVNEEGCEAAASTGAIMMLRMAMPCRPFIANRPFIFFIIDGANAQILFMGRYSDPKSSD